MTEKIDFPHDTGYKYLLSYQEVFLELLDSFVDQGWVTKLDRDHIARIDKSFILQDFAGKEADLVYQLKIDGQEVLFYLLFELQSSVDFQMPYRLLQYMVEIWRDCLKGVDSAVAERKDYRLPVIVPMILYNGEGNWTVCRSFKETLAGANLFGEYVLDFKYILIDVLRYQQESLVKLANLIGSVFLLDRQTDYDECYRRLEKVKKVVLNFDDRRLQLFGAWYTVIAMRDFPKEMREKLINEIDISKPEEVRTMISHLEQNFKRYYNEALLAGKKEGKLEGKIEGKIETAQNMLRMKLDANLIAAVTGLALDEIERLKLKL
jgi:predicted transposase/invertase (TIGR01784 family)